MECIVCLSEMVEEVNKFASEGAVQDMPTGYMKCPKCGYKERCCEPQNS